jgi:hypothetical protein
MRTLMRKRVLVARRHEETPTHWVRILVSLIPHLSVNYTCNMIFRTCLTRLVNLHVRRRRHATDSLGK